MKQTVSRYDFHRAFETIRPDNFTYAGREALFDWFEELEEDTREEIELDVIAVCCEFSEYQLGELGAYYGEYLNGADEPETAEEWAELLQDHTSVIYVDNETLILQEF